MGNNIISSKEIGLELLNNLVEISHKIFDNECNPLNQNNVPCILGCLFEQPSHRTKNSFLSAAFRSNFNIIDFSKSYYDELNLRGGNSNDFFDTIENLVTCLIVRCNDAELIKKIAKRISIPIINAGNGREEHPTQAMADISLLKYNFPELNKITIAMIGSLRDSRCANSLSVFLGYYKIKLLMICPEKLKLREVFISQAVNLGATIEWSPNLIDACGCDVLYFTGALEEDFSNIRDFNRYFEWFNFPSELVERIKKSALVMHPLPRGSETNSFYNTNFEINVKNQALHCLSMRMALLSYIHPHSY